MRRFILVLTLVLAACALPGGGVIPGGPYFPLPDGAEWDYSSSDGNTLKVTASQVTVRGTTTVANLTSTSTGAIATGSTAVVEVDTSGVTLKQEGISNTYFAYPARVGTTWQAYGTTFTIVGNQDVTVPAGTYRQTLVVQTASGSPVAVTEWFDRDTGIVKSVTPGDGTPSVRVLTRYKHP